MNFKTRLEKLELEAGDKAPLLVWGNEPEPDNPDNRPVLRLGWMDEEGAAK